MEHAQRPSLLDYARFYRIASDFTALDPLDYVNDIRGFQSRGDDTFPAAKLSESEHSIEDAHSEIEKSLHGGKLSISKEVARFLTLFIRKAQAKEIDIQWDELLPGFNQIRDIKLEAPIFSTSCESDTAISHSRLVYAPSDVDSTPLENSGGKSVFSVKKVPICINLPPKAEKLSCPKKSILLIQKASKARGAPLDAIDNILDAAWKSNPILPSSPLLRPLSPDQFPSSSPLQVPDEQMLPSPTSPDNIETELRYGQSITQIPHHEVPRNDSIYTQALTSSKEYTRHQAQDNAIPVVREKTPNDSTEDNIIKISSEYRPPGDSTNAMCGSAQVNALNSSNPTEVEGNNITSRKDEPALTETQGPEIVQLLTRANEEASSHSLCIEQARSPSGDSDPFTNEYGFTRELHLQPKRKIEYAQDGPRKTEKKSRALFKAALGANNKNNTLPCTPKPFGTLLSFMETRGKANKRRGPEESPYFTKTKGSHNAGRQNAIADPDPEKIQDEPATEAGHPVFELKAKIPQTSEPHDGLVLIVSTALLKTHLRLIQHLEGMKRPPKIIYRDYTTHDVKSQIQPEADIILSPKTGILLTTSQAIMQLYLPGHTPTSPQVSNIKQINSPLRERIFNISFRYEQIILLVSHGAEQARRSQGRESTKITAYEKLIACLNSLLGFCSSLSGYATVSLLLTPTSPEMAAGWILALAHKHAFQLPPRPRPQDLYNIQFTPINSRQGLRSDLGGIEESMRELFLRKIGLNPYAAQIVLAVMRREESVAHLGIDRSDPINDDRRRAGYLSRLIEMSSEERRRLFIGLIGERTLKRIDAVIEKDWQCDWVLNFKNILE